ncbi:hypothetical protein LINPERPRIM_LOCUS31244, partial [Linum perenne]
RLTPPAYSQPLQSTLQFQSISFHRPREPSIIQLGSFLTQPLTQLVLLFSSMAASSRTSILVLNYYSQAAAKELLLGGNTNAWTVPTSDSLNKWAQNTCFRIDDSLGMPAQEQTFTRSSYHGTLWYFPSALLLKL